MNFRNNFKNVIACLMLASFILLIGCTPADVKNLVSDGNAMPLSNSHIALTNPNKVKLFYAGNEKPKHFKIVGRISAENYSLIGVEHAQSTIAAELKKQAASIGASGVININTGLAQTSGDAVIIQ